MNILVTGGAGYIGSFLVSRLLHEGYRVRVADRFSGDKFRRCQAVWGKRVELVRHDLVEHQKQLVTLCNGIDWLVHLAAASGTILSQQQPIAFHRANVDATIMLLEAARAVPITRCIYSASASCYDQVQQVPISETAPIQPTSLYGLTKYLGEQYVLHWGKVYGLSIASLRLFDVYGPYSSISDSWGCLSRFIRQYRSGIPLTIRGDGNQKRDFIHVDDVINAILLMLRYSHQGIYNVGSGKSTSLNALAKQLECAVDYQPAVPTESQIVQADTKKLQTFGWRAAVVFSDGLRQSIATPTIR